MKNTEEFKNQLEKLEHIRINAWHLRCLIDELDNELLENFKDSYNIDLNVTALNLYTLTEAIYFLNGGAYPIPLDWRKKYNIKKF